MQTIRPSVRWAGRLAAATLALAAGFSASNVLAQEPIRIGAFLSSTGPAAFLGDPELKTLQLYVDKLNASGGVIGRKLQLVAYDDAGDAEKCRLWGPRACLSYRWQVPW